MLKINASGYLTSIAEKVMGGNLEREEKLSTYQIERICTYYGILAKREPLYDLLFEGSNKRLEVDGDYINTKDLMWFTMMDHAYARGWYWQPNGKATLDTSVCQGVPLALKGARRVFNKSYMSWIEGLEPKDYIKCDIFLPQGLNTLKVNDVGKVEKEEKNRTRGGAAGLIALHTTKDADFSVAHIHRLREQISAWATTSKPKMVKEDLIAEHDKDRTGELFNKCSFQMRSMILHGWTWYSTSRHSDQITDFKDWDNFLPSVDRMSIAMQGLEPKKTRVPEGFLKFTNSREEDLPVVDTNEYFNLPTDPDLEL